METSSVVLISLLGGVMLVFAIQNIKYNNGRDRAYQAYRKAVGMLKTEFKDNLDLADKTRNEMANCNPSRDRFKTQAWEELSTGPFLALMDEDASSDLRQIYFLIEKAEACRSQLIDASNHQFDASNHQSGSGGSAECRDDCRISLLRILDELAAKLRTHLARVK